MTSAESLRVFRCCYGNAYSISPCEACPHLAQAKEGLDTTGPIGVHVMNVNSLQKQSTLNQSASADPHVEWKTITPVIAAEMLKRNTLNRPKKPQKIQMYVEQMKGGAWPVTGTTIQFGSSGRLLDGQNRLQSIIDAGVTLRMLVVSGVDDDVFDVIDRGASRTASDVLVIMGYEGWIAATGSTASSVAFNLLGGFRPYTASLSPQAVREFVDIHPDLMSSVEFMSELPRKGVPMSHAPAAAVHFLMAKKDAMLADSFMQQLFVGNDMQSSDMVLKLRNSLIARESSGAAKGRDGKTMAVGAVIKTWNSRRAGRSIVHIGNAFPRASEPFPQVM